MSLSSSKCTDSSVSKRSRKILQRQNEEALRSPNPQAGPSYAMPRTPETRTPCTLFSSKRAALTPTKDLATTRSPAHGTPSYESFQQFK